jgi:hypothetical protein
MSNKSLEIYEKSNEQIVLNLLIEGKGENYIEHDVILNEKDLRKIYHDCKDWQYDTVTQDGEHLQSEGEISYEYFIKNFDLYELEVIEYIEKFKI